MRVCCVCVCVCLCACVVHCVDGSSLVDQVGRALAGWIVRQRAATGRASELGRSPMYEPSGRRRERSLKLALG